MATRLSEKLYTAAGSQATPTQVSPTDLCDLAVLARDLEEKSNAREAFKALTKSERQEWLDWAFSEFPHEVNHWLATQLDEQVEDLGDVLAGL